MLSFLFVLPLWYIWALLWGQVYWTDTNLWIEITYSSPLSIVPYKAPIFPLPIVYSIVFFLTFSVFYISNMYIKFKALLWYLALMSFSVLIFILEFFSWKFGLIKDNIWINLNQVSVIFLFLFGLYKIYKIYTKNIEV